MTDTITVRGLVATDPKSIVTATGVDVTTFRMASTRRRLDKDTGIWVDSDVNWYTVSSFRGLAQNVSASISKGQRVLVTGNLKVRDWDNGERSGTSVEIDAKSIGHDLIFGTSEFERRSPISIESDEEDEDAELDRELQPA